MRRHALLVGIDAYEAARLGPLLYAEADARELASVLGELCGFETLVLLGSRATRAEIIAAIARGWLADETRRIEEEDQFLFYFAGLGQPLVPGGRFVVLPFDAVPSSEDTRFVSVEFLMDLLEREVRARQCMCVLETSTGGLRDIGTAARRPERKQVQVLLACSEGEYACEDCDLGHGVLTYFLLESLRWCVARGTTTFMDVAEETGRRMRSWRHPVSGKCQTPRFLGNPGRIVLASRPGAKGQGR